jgi:hypothetical protein
MPAFFLHVDMLFLSGICPTKKGNTLQICNLFLGIKKGHALSGTA